MRRRHKRRLIKICITIVIIVLLSLIILNYKTPKNQKILKIGAILPLSGPAAVFGEAIREGTELAIEELKEKGIEIEVIYEDSQAQPGPGLTAYRKLKDINDVDIVFSAFSRVSVPLLELIDQDKMPFFMTMVSAKDAAEQSKYAFRFFQTETQVGEKHFETIQKLGIKEIAIVYLEDEYGTSVKDAIKRKADELNIDIILEERYPPGNTDFRTQLTKVKQTNPEAIVFVGAVPPETINIIKQAKEMQIEAEFFESSPQLAVPRNRKATAGASEGVYTLAYPFRLGTTGQSFREDYKKRFGKEPLAQVTYGYNILMLIIEASDGEILDSDQLVQNILDLKTYDSLDGLVEIKPNGEINPDVVSVKIVNDTLVVV